MGAKVIASSIWNKPPVSFAICKRVGVSKNRQRHEPGAKSRIFVVCFWNRNNNLQQTYLRHHYP